MTGKLFSKKNLVIVAIFIVACNNNRNQNILINSTASTPLINYSVVKEYPHDSSLFTEGLVFRNGILYESTGSPQELAFTKSMIGSDDLLTGKFDKKIELDKTKYFGEGIAFLNNKIYQLTYKNKEGFIYNAKSFKQTGTFAYANKEGWSLTTDNKNLIMSDGTDKITFLDSSNLLPIKILLVTENGSPAFDLNELEFIKGYIYANVWQTNTIIKIDTATGNVVAKFDFNSLVMEAKNKNPNIDVLNGIAYDSVSDKIFVTGKLWPNIYEINFPH